MQGRREQQLMFSDALCPNQIPKDSYWSKILASKWMIQCSAPCFRIRDAPQSSLCILSAPCSFSSKNSGQIRGLEEASRFDDCVKYALEVSRDFAGIDAVTFCKHRTRFIESGVIFSLFAGLLADAKAKDLIFEDKLQIVDCPSWFIAQALCKIRIHCCAKELFGS